MKKMNPYILAVLSFNILLICGSISSGLNKGEIGYYFKEAKAVTFFSAFFLGNTAVIAALLSYIHARFQEGKSLLNFWLISTIGFTYLMLDEYFMIHEGMDRAILKSFGMPERSYNFDGWLLGLLGLIGYCIVLKFKIDLFKYNNFVRLMTIGFICFVIMILADQTEHYHQYLKVVDDSFKILGVSFFLVAYISVLLDNFNRLLSNNS